MLVERSLKKFSSAYTPDVSEEETVWGDMDIDDSELKHDPKELDPE